MLECPICGSDKILGEEGKYFCYDFEFDEIKPFSGLIIPHRSFHRVHGPFPSVDKLTKGNMRHRQSDHLIVYVPPKNSDTDI